MVDCLPFPPTLSLRRLQLLCRMAASCHWYQVVGTKSKVSMKLLTWNYMQNFFSELCHLKYFSTHFKSTTLLLFLFFCSHLLHGHLKHWFFMQTKEFCLSDFLQKILLKTVSEYGPPPPGIIGCSWEFGAFSWLHFECKVL